MFTLNIFSCSHSIISSLSLLILSYPDNLGNYLKALYYYYYYYYSLFGFKIVCKASDKCEVSSLGYMVLTIREICCLHGDNIVLVSGFVPPAIGTASHKPYVGVSSFQLPSGSVSYTSRVFYISQGHFLQFVLTELSPSLNTCENLSL